MILRAHDVFFAYHSAIDFACFIGSLASDAPIDYGIYLSHDEVDANGDFITDDTLPGVNWDVTAEAKSYEPKKRNGPIYVVHTARWIKVQLTIGEVAPSYLRFYLRGRAF